MNDFRKRGGIRTVVVFSPLFSKEKVSCQEYRLWEVGISKLLKIVAKCYQRGLYFTNFAILLLPKPTTVNWVQYSFPAAKCFLLTISLIILSIVIIFVTITAIILSVIIISIVYFILFPAALPRSTWPAPASRGR